MIKSLFILFLLPLQVQALGTYSWEVVSEWKKINGQFEGQFSSTHIVQGCHKFPDRLVEFPPIIQGAQEVYVDKKLVARFGDPTFKSVGTYYGAPYVDCEKILQGKEVLWKTYSFVQGFANFYYYPRLSKTKSFYFFNELIYVIGTGVMLILALFSFVTFFKKISNEIVISLVFSSIFYAIFFAICASEYFGVTLSMLHAHKLSDSSLMVGCFLFLNVLRIEGYINKYLFLVTALTMLVGIILIILGTDGTEIQKGTSLPFLMVLCSMLFMIFKIIKRFSKMDRGNLFMAISLCCNSFTSIYDILSTEGLVPPYFFYCIGAVAGILFMALSVHEHILKTYEERDYLRKNLEQEVVRKTAELEEKNVTLKTALENLHHKEAELIQSEKLASLGTLSAGIAHEINNSLNYVNGSLGPLTKLLKKNEELSDKSRTKMFTFIDMMKEGLENTFEIIRSLKNHTGLNQSAWKDVNVLDSVKASLTILQSRIKQGVNVELDIDSSHHFFGNTVGFGQIITNLMINSIDAMNEQGTIKIYSTTDDEYVYLTLEDSGGGIPSEILKNVFDPFFTTKEVGKGTGLGLYIVNQEMQKHHGEIKIEVIEQVGSKFMMKFPINDKKINNKEAS